MYYPQSSKCLALSQVERTTLIVKLESCNWVHKQDHGFSSSNPIEEKYREVLFCLSIHASLTRILSLLFSLEIGFFC